MPTSITTTKKYDLFELHEFNRDVTRVEKLELSMSKYGWLDPYPMHVVRNGGKKLIIKDGHHRFEVAKKLSLPVKYVICNDNRISIHELQKTTNTWNLKDYLVSYIRTGNPEYIAVKEYVDETGIPVNIAISLVGGESSGSHNFVNAFKDGRYKIGNQLHANQIKNIIFHIKKVGVAFATSALFLQALSKVLRVKEVDMERLKSKISVHSSYFERQPNVESYLDAIEAIYNRQSKDRVPVAFLAKEKAKERSQLLFKKQTKSKKSAPSTA